MGKFKWDKFGDRMIKGDCKIMVFQSLRGLVAIGSLISFLSAMALGYVYLFPRFQMDIHNYGIPESNVSNGTCNVFEGSWIYDKNYPLYDASRCPFVERGFNCLANGREDNGYEKWRWKPRNCDIPSFNARTILEKFRGKRVVFVGDSLSRTQWESLICLLMNGVEDKKTVYEVRGHKITKNIRFLGVLFSSFNLRIDFYRSVFLVQHGPKPRLAPKWVKSTLRLDKLDDINEEWIDSDVLIFNSGHWWTKSRLFHEIFDSSISVPINSVASNTFPDRGCYFQVGNSLNLGMPVITGFRRALETWKSWAETRINTDRTRVFFRTFESTHWSGQKWNTCKVTQRPWSKTNGRDRSTISENIIEVVKKMRIPVTLMHVTPMCAFRSDGHVGRWSDNPAVPDCSHWCLPGVPDTWNEILFSLLLPNN